MTTGPGAGPASPASLESLAFVLGAVARAAHGGVRGQHQWADLERVVQLPAPSGPSGAEQLRLLRTVPASEQLATDLAKVLQGREVVDGTFGAAFRAWWALPAVQTLLVSRDRLTSAADGGVLPEAARRPRFRALLSGFNAKIVVPVLVVAAGAVAVPLATTFGDRVNDVATGNTPAGVKRQVEQQIQAGPLTVLSESQHRDDTNYALPGTTPLTPDQLAGINAQVRRAQGADVPAALAALGAYAQYYSQTQLLLTNAGRSPITLVSIAALKTCTAPASGTVFSDPSEGVDQEVHVGFDLDAAQSTARQVTGHLVKATDPDYFADHTVSFAPGERIAFTLVAVTARSACRFRFDFGLVIADRPVHQIITDTGGRDFRVTAVLPDHTYAVAYEGGVSSPTGDGLWSRVDPRLIG